MKIQYIFVSYLLILLTTFTHATVYEDGTNSISTWGVYDNTPTGASISSIYDTDRGSDVIKLQGAGTRNGYILGYWRGSTAWDNTEEKTLKWSMKYSERFVIYVSMQTTMGHRYIYYTQSESDRGLHDGAYIHHGLGKTSKNDTWQTFTRDLESDLKKYESDNSIVSVNAFFVRGSGLFDDISLVGEDVTSNKVYSVETTKSLDDSSMVITKANLYIDISNSKVKIKTIFESDESTYGYILDSVEFKTIANVSYLLVHSRDIAAHHHGNLVTYLWRTDGSYRGTFELARFSTFRDTFLEKPKFTTYNNGKLGIEYSEQDLSSGEIMYDSWETDGTVDGTIHLNQ